MKLRKFLLWMLLAIVGYNLYGYTKQHMSGDVLAYKRLASAVAKNDTNTAQKIVLNSNLATELSEAHAKRQELIGDQSVIFTYYRIKQQRYSSDGNISFILAEQVSRVNPPGVNTLIGENEVRVQHGVQLVRRDNEWFVQKFHDPVMVQ